MTDLLNTNLLLNLTTADINLVHRLPRANTNASSSAATKPTPVIIQFVNKSIRNSVLSNRKLLKGKGFSITEQLTSRKAAILRKASELVTSSKLLSAWSHDGKVLVKTLQSNTIAIASLADLMKF
jgi:hypothetical protein